MGEKTRRGHYVAGLRKRSAKPRGKPFEPGNPYRWQPGQSGNPSGGTKGQTLTGAFREMLSLPVPTDLKRATRDLIEQGATFAQIIAFAQGRKAVAGEQDAVTQIATQTGGTPEVNVNLTVQDVEAQRKRRWEQIAPALARVVGGGDESQESARET